LPGPEERIKLALERIAEPADPEGAMAAVARRRGRRRLVRRVQMAALVVAVLAGTAGGGYALLKVFGARGHTRPGSSLPANGRIAFVEADRIYTMNPDGTGRTQLSDEGADSRPAWSPDGTRLAFVHAAVVPDPSGGVATLFAGRDSEITLVNADGMGLTNLTGNPATDTDAAWSPDGSMIAFSSDRSDGNRETCDFCDFDIYVMNADGSGVRQLTSGPDQDVSPTWSPDGSKIAFVRMNGQEGGVETEIVNVDGSGLRRLLSCDRSNPDCPEGQAARWSPDGATIAFLGGTMGIRVDSFYLADADGSNVRRIPLDCAPATCPIPMGGSWAPDGTKLVLSSIVPSDGPCCPGNGLYVMNPDGTGMALIGEGDQPSWQPVVRSPATPSASPSSSPSPTPTQQPSPSPSSAPPPLDLGQECNATTAVADFDGNGAGKPDGKLDRATVFKSSCGKGGASGDGYTIWVDWNTGASGGWHLGACDASGDTCAIVAAHDFNADGVAELAVRVSRGASTEFLTLFELTISEAGPDPLEVQAPGADGYPAGEPAIFAVSGTVTHVDSLICSHVDDYEALIATHAERSDETAGWNLREVVFRFEGPWGDRSLRITLDREFTISPEEPPAAEGLTCW
jgi:Tol biopolymer transport system component